MDMDEKKNKEIEKKVDAVIAKTPQYQEIKEIQSEISKFLHKLESKFSTYDAHLYITLFHTKCTQTYSEMFLRIKEDVKKQLGVN